MRHDAAEISRALAARMERLAPELLPQGHRDRHEWRCGSIAGEPGETFGVALTGRKAGLFHDYNGGDSGDALDLVAAVRFGGDIGQALAWARDWLGVAAHAPNPPAAPTPQAAVPDSDEADAARRRGMARRIFEEAHPSLAGTPAARYLAGRGIDLADLARQPRALRFHPALYHSASRREWPALLAAIIDGGGAHVATHRTYLHEVSPGHWTKAPVPRPKMVLGLMAGGHIPLWRGASRTTLSQAPAGETVVIGEGIETALSVALACPELRVLSAVSLSNMARVALPAEIGTVILCADNDGDNPAAARGLARAVDHYASSGCVVRIARSPIGKDFNDALQSDAAA